MNEDKPRTCYTAEGKPKVRYTRRRDAQRAAFAVDGHFVLPYHCPTCKGWHIGNSTSPSAERRLGWVAP